MKPFIQVPVKYGVIAGLVGFTLVIILYYINRHPFLIQPYMDFRIVLFGVFIFFSLKEYRDYYQEGTLYIWEGLISSFIFVTTFAIVASTLIAIFASVVPEFVATYIVQATERTKNLPPELLEQIGKEEVDRNLRGLASTNVFGLALQYFLQSYMIGLFISIILSVILRRQPKN